LGQDSVRRRKVSLAGTRELSLGAFLARLEVEVPSLELVGSGKDVSRQ
jgi:hypothetical protein